MITKGGVVIEEAAGSVDPGAPDEGGLSFEELFSLERLRRTWRALRKETRLVNARDVLDWIDWSVAIEGSLEELREEIINGTYRPTQPTRYEHGKAKGSYRVISSLNIRDALVYRHIADLALQRALPHKIKGAFYSRRHARTPVGKTFSTKDDPYLEFFAIWLSYNEYRTRTLLNDIYNVLLVTDITNYFESIQHELMFEYLTPLGLPRKAAGLLGRLLETFKPDARHSPSPRVGLPVDEFDCSRELAHVFLFEHDRRVVQKYGEEHYVRWMDDQNVGVRSEAEGRRVVKFMTGSLASQRLTLNAGKTTFLSPSGVAVHFQLAANEMVNRWERAFKEAGYRVTDELRNGFESMWQELREGDTAGKGNWEKVLKRLYALAIRVDSAAAEAVSFEHLVAYPDLAQRIFQYHAKRNRGLTMVNLFERYRRSGENLFEATEAQFFEAALLLMNPDQNTVAAFRRLAGDFARQTLRDQTGRPLGRASATIALYWFGEAPTELASLYSCGAARRLPKEVARAWMAVVAAVDPRRLGGVLGCLFGHSSDDVARLGGFLTELLRGRVSSLGNYKHLRSRWPLSGKYYDARSWLLWDLSSQSSNTDLRRALIVDAKRFRKVAQTGPERRILARVCGRLGLASATEDGA